MVEFCIVLTTVTNLHHYFGLYSLTGSMSEHVYFNCYMRHWTDSVFIQTLFCLCIYLLSCFLEPLQCYYFWLSTLCHAVSLLLFLTEYTLPCRLIAVVSDWVHSAMPSHCCLSFSKVINTKQHVLCVWVCVEPSRHAVVPVSLGRLWNRSVLSSQPSVWACEPSVWACLTYVAVR